MRGVLAVCGLAMLAWGGWCLLVQLRADPGVLPSAAVWLAAGPVLADLLVLPAAAAVSLVLARVLPAWLRAPAAAGLVVSGVLVAIAVPLLWRAHAPNRNPGLVDRDYLSGLGLALTATWTLVLLAALLARRFR